jgi:hypothetical protein
MRLKTRLILAEVSGETIGLRERSIGVALAGGNTD